MWRAGRDLIEADFADTYGLDVDLADPTSCDLLGRRSWRWFLVRYYGLLAAPTRARVVDVWRAAASDS